jgi:DNA-directed RNA polymerase sigma subunit (sigma70/sigma32)
MQTGDSDARDRLIASNTRLVVLVAPEYEGLGLPLNRLIRVGHEGLVRGVERFDAGKEVSLATLVTCSFDRQ